MKAKIFSLSVLALSLIFSCKKETVSENATEVSSSHGKHSADVLAVVNVALGGNIQSAIDQVAAAGGGTVNLASGTYTITSPIQMKSNVILNGAGNPTTTIQGGNFNIITYATEGLQNVTIQNLKVVGTHSESCYGILIQASTTYHQNISIKNVQVTSAGMGVHFKRVNGLNVSNCNIHSNGAPGQEYYFHNLYIRSCNTVNVSDTYMNNGSTGNGLNVSYCTGVSVLRCTANNNFFRGMRAADTDGFTVKACTITGNQGTGLIGNQEAGLVTKNINWDGNTVNNNIGGGVQILNGSTGQVINNTATGNTGFNYSIGSGVTASNNN